MSEQTRRREPKRQEAGKHAKQEEKQAGYGNKKLEGPDRPST
ncbi:hypothetical protein ACFO4N_03980 [Camelliibacillus cellulosilyticus]|uniref:Small acid-soluble spore protein P (Minor) n=1 Tax=Camelliibacillus cellulosilyticus TaxID=2174486 RepID=A0ABV9GKU9_9BACL